MEYYTAIGIDVSDKTSKICMMEKVGTERRVIRRDGFAGYLADVDRSVPVTFETGTHSRWMRALIEDELGFRNVYVANPAKLTFTLKRGEGCELFAYDPAYGGDDYSGLNIDDVWSDGDSLEVGNEYRWNVDPDAWLDCSADEVTLFARITGEVGQKCMFLYRLFNGYSEVVFDCMGGALDPEDPYEEFTTPLERNVSIADGLKNYWEPFALANPSMANYFKGMASFDKLKPSRSQYTFVGWFTEEMGGTKVTGKTIVPDADEGITYYAHWTYDGSAYVGVVVSDECEGMGTVSGGNKSFKSGAKVASQNQRFAIL